MILVTVGSTRFPFKRMDTLVSELIKLHPSGEKIIFQHGKITPTDHGKSITMYPFMKQSKLLSCMKRARLIICHGGPGTIYQALSFKKTPWVLPRKKQFKEHLTDHQVSFCQFMKRRGLVNVISDRTPLSDILKGSQRTPPVHKHDTKLIEYLSTLLAQ